MVGKYDGPNDDPTCISCISHGGFKKPRELTWVTGVVVLAVLTASFGVTGYSLPWDKIGYWAVKIVTGVPDAIPLIGSPLPLVELLRGSASVGQSTLTRYYSLHTFVLPLLTAVFMLMHFPMIRGSFLMLPWTATIIIL
ncbi:putative cytochrome b/b6, di-hem cytochrome, transmembrane, cytochrome b6, PetB [Helianthus anomalus]